MTASTIVRTLGQVQSFPPPLAEDLPGSGWTLAHVRPRHEKLLAANLRRFAVPHLLFLERRVRTYKRQGVQQSEVPLLPGYMFLHCAPDAWDQIYSTDRVLRLSEVRRPDQLRSELTDLIALVRRADAPLIVRPELVPGRAVTLLKGTLAGLRGVIATRRGRSELLVNVSMLGTAVGVQVAAADVE